MTDEQDQKDGDGLGPSWAMDVPSSGGTYGCEKLESGPAVTLRPKMLVAVGLTWSLGWVGEP